ncbi:MAG: hypothetical protein QF561_03005 [Phycisphaerales bacterium]|nr:hypothetical protein [Phycisphaerales bacterium]
MRVTMLVATTAVLGLSAGALGDVLYSNSFENTDALGGKYYDTGDANVAHDLVNNAGEAWVDVDGMDAGYIPFDPPGVGLTDGDYVGVTNYTGSVGAFYDGDQGYQMSDTDGVMSLSSADFAGATSVSLALFIADTGYEDTDYVQVFFGGVELLSIGGTDDGGAALEAAAGSWFEVTGAVAGGALEIYFASNSGSEALFIDAIVIEGIPAPGALALLAVAGFAGRRRRR